MFLNRILGLVVLLVATTTIRAQESNKPLPADTAVLEVDAPKGTQVFIAGKDYGEQTRFTYRPMAAGKWYNFAVEALLPGESQRRAERVLIRGGWRVRLPFYPTGSQPRVVVQNGHSNEVSRVVFSPDGKQLLTGGNDGVVVLWEVATGQQVHALRIQADYINALAYRSDGKEIISAHSNGVVARWNAHTGELVKEYQIPGGVLHGAVSNDGQRVLVRVNTDNKTVCVLLDGATGKRLRQVEGHQGEINDANFSPDGRLHATGGMDGQAIIWDTATGAIQQRIRASDSPVYHVRFTPDGRYLLAAGTGQPGLWEVATGKKAVTLEGDIRLVRGVSFSPDGKRLLARCQTGQFDLPVILWDTQTGRKLKTTSDPKDNNYSVALHPDGQHFALPQGDTAVLRALKDGAVVRTFAGENHFVLAAQFTPDGKTLLAELGARHVRRENDLDMTAWAAWDLATGRRREFYPGHLLAWSPDGKFGAVWIDDKMSALQIRELASGRTVATIQQEKDDGFYQPFFSPDSRYVALLHRERISVWETGTGKKLRNFASESTFTAWPVWSANSQFLAQNSIASVLVWEVRTGRQVKRLAGNYSTSGRVAFSPDARQLVVTPQFGAQRVQVVDIASGQPLREIPLPGDFSHALYSPDGKHVFLGGSRYAGLWEVSTGRKVQTFPIQGYVMQPGFHPDGRYLLFVEGTFGGAAHGRTSKLWDLATGREVAQLVNLNQGRDWLLVSPEGFFDGTPLGRQKVAYRVGTGLTVVPVDRFFQDFYRTGLLASLMHGELGKADVKLGETRPPTVRIVAPKSGATFQPQTTLEVEAVDEGGGLKGPWLTHNGARVLGSGPASRDGKLTRRSFTVALVQGDNVLEVKAASADGSWESEPARITLRLEKPLPKAELYVLAIGINRYADSKLDLKFASADAGAVAALFQKRGRQLYQQVHATSLLDGQATQKNIRAALDEIAKKARPQDTFVMFLAGHGAMVGQRYYFLTHEFQRTAGRTLDEDLRKQGLPGDELGDDLAAVPALKRVLIFDTCHSGGVVGLVRSTRNPFAFRGAIERLARSQGVFTIAASAANEEAQEVNELGHGVLTYTLLAGLRAVGKGPLADRGLRPDNPERVATVLEWFDYASGQVPRLTQRYFGREQDVQTSGQGTSFPVLPVEER